MLRLHAINDSFEPKISKFNFFHLFQVKIGLGVTYGSMDRLGII
jgi:hypothetical protein